VAVLSINGLLVHYFVLPRIRNQVGKRLLDGLSPFDCSLVLLAGTVSAISWYVPLVLGAIPQLNYVVPAEVILSSYAVLVLLVNAVIQGAIVFFLNGHSMPVISDRSKINILRGSFALVFALICGSLFMTKTNHYGEASLVDSATKAVGERETTLASNAVELESASSKSGKDAARSGLEFEPSLTGAPRDSAETAVWQNEGKVPERTALMRSANATERELFVTGNAESFASLPRGSREEVMPQLNSFVGLWAADARACEFRPGTGSDPLTVISERGARAGGNSCEFKKKKRISSSEWEIKAACADGSTRWESTVLLSVSKNKLKWTGQRGTQSYVRCIGDIALGQTRNPRNGRRG
jgi:hypothetical protein